MKRHICASTDTCAVFISLFVENEQTDKHIIGSIWFSFRGFRDAFSYLCVLVIGSLNVSFSIHVRQVNISFALACPAEDVFYLVLLFRDLPFPQRRERRNIVSFSLTIVSEWAFTLSLDIFFWDRNDSLKEMGPFVEMVLVLTVKCNFLLLFTNEGVKKIT
jgi:hypothetical protein